MDEGSIRSSAVWPAPAFFFEVRVDGSVMSFEEVTGLSVEVPVIEYRHGGNNAFATKMPGLAKFSNVTMKNGVIKTDNHLGDWLGSIQMNDIKKKPATISLLDLDGKAMVVWTLVDAFPVKISISDLESNGQVIAIESLEIAHSGLTTTTC